MVGKRKKSLDPKSHAPAKAKKQFLKRFRALYDGEVRFDN